MMSRIDDLIAKYCPNGVVFEELQKVADVLNGYAFKSNKYTESGIRVIRISDVQKGKISNKDIKYYPIDMQNEIKDFLLFENDLVMSLTGNVGRVAILPQAAMPAALNQRVACIRPRSYNVMTRYLYHWFDQDEFEKNAMNAASGAGQKNMSTSWLNRQLIPIPPKPVQEEIVKILDSFTELEAELEAEQEARKKQYEYYRDELISFSVSERSDNTKKTMKLYEITIWDKKFNGVEKYMQDKVLKYPYLLADDLIAMKRDEGNVFLLSTGESIGWTTEEVAGNNLCEGEIVSIPWGKSRPVVECMKYYKGKFVTADNRIVTSKDILILDNKYLFYWMQMRGEDIDKFYRGAGIQHPNMKDVLNMTIVLPPLPEQKRIVAILDKFDALVNDISVGLPAEIAARRKQYEYYRNKLLDFKKAE